MYEWKGFPAVHSHRYPFCPPLGIVWSYWLPLESEGVGLPATHNDAGQLTMDAHIYCYGLAQRSFHPPHLLLLSSDGLLSSLLVFGVCCGLFGLQQTIGNCPVFPLCDSKLLNSQQLHSLSMLSTYILPFFNHIVFFLHLADKQDGFCCWVWMYFQTIQRNGAKV